ncbi:hypothetical protein QYE76_024017 [Lolium multiflorum]|uniref:Integrase zinc-binding domain-containing protein n=1 Tax=Lolium multiflorum TaxID=4521 RepID=A0AAD8VVB7_LOLMU|nr:hypothetical protein QYE76_024017 [Lolium multiflorum]
MSKTLGPKNRGLSTYEKECLAILMAVDKWRPYLQRSEFIIKIDQKALTHLDDQSLSTPWQHRALTKLLGLHYKIQYKKGHENKVADALSRHVAVTAQEVLALSTCKPTWLEEIKAGYLQNDKTKRLLAELAVSEQAGPFSLKQGIIQFKGRIWLHSESPFKKKILQALHASAVGGHSGFAVTYHRIKNLFAWARMKKEIKDYVSTCEVCQQAKPERVKYPGLLEPLPTPKKAWRDFSMDFIEGIPKSTGMTPELATWEDENAIKAKFPGAPAWGQAMVKEGGDVRDLLPATTTEDELQKALEDKKGQPSSSEATGLNQAPAQPRRSKRGLIPSTRYDSTEWTR